MGERAPMCTVEQGLGSVRYETVQPFVTTGGALPLPTQPVMPTATNTASRATKIFFIGAP